MRSNSIHATWLAVTVVLALLAAACGGADEEGTSSEPDDTPDQEETVDGDDSSEPSPDVADIDYGEYTPACDDPTEVHGFLTCADVEAALAEGEVVLYAPSVEPAQIAILDAFTELFPEIRGNNVRLQTGALYARLQQERQSNTYMADVLVLSDMSMLREFQDEGGFEDYVSPEIYAYPWPEHLSEPVGFFQSWGTLSAGIAYNPQFVSPEDAPETWEDLLDPQWEGRISFKMPTSGLQALHWWHSLNLYGEEYWDEMREQSPIGFDSMVQQYDRLVDGEDLIMGNAQYSGYLQAVQDGANLEFVIPPDGLPAGPESYGLVTPRPNEEAGKLFIDFLMSEPGQMVVQRELNYHSVRQDMPAPEGGVTTEEANFQLPDDWEAFVAERSRFEQFWSELLGIN